MAFIGTIPVWRVDSPLSVLRTFHRAQIFSMNTDVFIPFQRSLRTPSVVQFMKIFDGQPVDTFTLGIVVSSTS
jgi:hypothetical protein